MPKIRIVTDSTSDLSAAVRKAWRIEMVPMTIHFGSEEYLDGVTITPDEFYGKLVAANALPTTSQASPLDYLETYKQLLDADPAAEILSIHLSSGFSGTYQSASLARSMLDDPDRVSMVDSKSASIGCGWLAIEAARMAEAGRSRQDILAALAELRRQLRIYFVVDSLEYLYKGGRIGKAASLFGTMLQIKPILSIDDDGIIYMKEKTRGLRKAHARIGELLAADYPGGGFRFSVAYAMERSGAEELAALVRERTGADEPEFLQLGPAIGVHAGPGVTAVFAVPRS